MLAQSGFKARSLCTGRRELLAPGLPFKVNWIFDRIGSAYQTTLLHADLNRHSKASSIRQSGDFAARDSVIGKAGSEGTLDG